MKFSSKKGRGQIAVELLFLSAVIVALITGFVSLAASLLQISVRAQNKLQAFAIAEAGIEYYRWHLAHAAADFTDGTGTPGPYVHPYYNKDGVKIGQFSLAITPPTPGSTVVAITSTGSVLADATIQKIIRVQMQISSFTAYAIIVNDNLRMGSGTEVFGKIMANGGIHFDGYAHNIVQSGVACYNDPDYNSGTNQEFGVYTRVSPIDPYCPASVPLRPDVFAAGRSFPVPAVDFGIIAQTLATIKAQAQASGTYYGPSGAYGYDLALATSGIYSIYKVTALAPPPNGCTNTSNQPGWGTWSIQNESFIATGTIPQNGVIFAEDDLWVKGQINNKRVTIGAARFPDNSSTRANINVNTNLLYTNYNGSDVIGLVAQNNFNLGLFSDDTMEVDGALIAQNGRAGRFYYAPPNVQSNSQKCGPTVVRQQITFYGSVISNLRYGFGYTDATGYQVRNLNYDNQLLYNPPPRFPQTTDQYSLTSWSELQ